MATDDQWLIHEQGYRVAGGFERVDMIAAELTHDHRDLSSIIFDGLGRRDTRRDVGVGVDEHAVKLLRDE